VFDRIYTEAYQPFAENKIQMMEALDKGAAPLKEFMLKQTRQSDLALFVKLSRGPALQGRKTCRCACWCRPSSPAN
jgi:flagellar biosynthetic protein FliP